MAAETGELSLELEGIVDISRADDLHAQARAMVLQSGNVTVRCAKLERVDVSGAQVLIALRRRLRGEGRDFYVADVPPNVLASLAQAGLVEALTSTGDPGSPPCPST